MRFLMDNESYQEMLAIKDPTPDCYADSGKYLHHVYRDGVKYVVTEALMATLQEAQTNRDAIAYRHLFLHKKQLEVLSTNQGDMRGQESLTILGDPPPTEEETTYHGSSFIPRLPQTIEETGLNRSTIDEMILRVLYNLGRATGKEISKHLGLAFLVLSAELDAMRQRNLIDISGQTSIGETGYEYMLKPPKGTQAGEDALKKTTYAGCAPVPFDEYLNAIEAQTIKNIVTTRKTIRMAFKDLIITDAVLNEIGPAINSADSIFLFGYPGNGKTSIAERITRLMGDDIYIPYAIDVDGQIIKIFDPVLHTKVEEITGDISILVQTDDFEGNQNTGYHDMRWVRVKRPTIVVGGELSMEMLDLNYNRVSRFYEGPLQMKANTGIFMIDDFGRQQIRPIDLLNRWIVPLEKKYDYLTTITGNKIQVPFDVLLIFSTNLDPSQLVDEAFLRRIKYKIEVRDPSETQWRQIWDLVCNGKGVELDHKGLDYMIYKWYKPFSRPLRMCHPRDILNQMISMAKYNMESVNFSPDLIDAACESYFISVEEKKDFGAQVDLR